MTTNTNIDNETFFVQNFITAMKKPTQFLQGKFISLEVAITNKQKKALLVTLILLKHCFHLKR